MPTHLVVATVGAIFLTCLAASEHYIVPIWLARVRLIEPRELIVLRTSPDIPLGSKIPQALRNHGLPLDLVVHVDCIGCRIEPPTDVEAAFHDKRITNLVLASDTDAYEAIARKFGTPIILGNEDLIRPLHASFGPRLYRFDKEGHLYFVQDSRPNDYETFLNEALTRSQ